MKQEKMMKQYHENIEAEVRQTMQLLDEVKPLEVHHLFREQLMRRIEEELEQGEMSKRSNGLDYRLAFVALLFVINLASTLLAITPDENQPVATVGQLADNQSDDYSGQEFAYYDQTTSYERKKP